jgi:hypothetical protein
MGTSMPRSRSAEPRTGGLEHQHLGDVDGGEAAAHHHDVVLRLEDGSVVPRLAGVVEPDDEGVLVDEPLAHVGVGALDGQGAVAPGAVGEDHRRETPRLRELGEGDVPPDPGQRQVVDPGLAQLPADGLVLLPAQGRVPSRQTVLDLAVWARILFEDGDDDAAAGEAGGHLGSCGGATDHGHRMGGPLGHGNGLHEPMIAIFAPPLKRRPHPGGWRGYAATSRALRHRNPPVPAVS